uniref:Uncharacterized protein n=1 Tax=Arundo donax TaxID=35708 RepID=A0A0A9AF31_ARUDO
MFAGFRSRWTIGSGFLECKKASPQDTSKMTWNRRNQCSGWRPLLLKSWSSRLPFFRYSYTRQPISGQKPSSKTRLGC